MAGPVSIVDISPTNLKSLRVGLGYICFLVKISSILEGMFVYSLIFFNNPCKFQSRPGYIRVFKLLSNNLCKFKIMAGTCLFLADFSPTILIILIVGLGMFLVNFSRFWRF